MILAAAAAGTGDVAAPRHDDPLTRPIAADYAKRWLSPQTPARVHGNSYLVGFGGLNVALIRTADGLILIDGAVPQAVADIEANIARLGFDIKDVKLILSTEPHYDHAGGIAALARDSGATVIAAAAAVPTLRSGKPDRADPQAAMLPAMPGTKRVRPARDGERISLGGVTVTAQATPGHTAGSMSWSWRSCERDKCLDVVFGSSLNPISAEDYRFADHPTQVRWFRASFERLRKLPCDILITAHPDQSGGDEKMRRLIEGARPNPFVDAGACRAYADKFEALLDARLARESGET